MQRFKNLLFTASISLNCLLLFLLLFESRLSIPAWLQVAGRMHPLILHFPVVLVILYAISSLLLPSRKVKADNGYREMADWLLLLAALSSAITALMGLFLSKEEGYDSDVLQWHKWSGVGVSAFTLGWYYFREISYSKKFVGFSSSLIAICLVIFAGHQGAGITHGQNFLLAPMLPEKEKKLVPIEEAEVYADMVRPVIEAKCMSCHNSKKAKGELVMETEALLLKGGKNGALWDSAAADLGLMLQRIHLPLEQKKHMPPQGKTQLTEQEITILTEWIKKGADFKLRVADLPEADTLKQLATIIFTAAETASYDFESADPSVIRELNTVNRIVTEESINSPALSVSFFNSQLFQPEQLKELSKIKKQIVALDLAKMPIKDENLATIGEFENLRKLNLNFSAITGATLGQLKKLKHLRSLSLSGTKLNLSHLKELKNFPQLKTVYTWNIPVSASDMDQLAKEVKDIRYESGFRGDTMILQLSPPILLNEESVLTGPIALKLKHYINGTSIRYTIDGSEPDSLKSPLFNDKVTIDKNVLIRAKAYKPGWISSELMEANFYMSKYKPDTVIFVNVPDPAYKPDSKLLINLIKGETNFRNGNWLAWRQSRMEVILHLPEADTVHSVTLSTLTDIGSYIMPPASIEIWGGDEPGKLKLLGRLSPPQPGKLMPASLRGFEVLIKPTKLSFIKLIAIPVAKLPVWHPGKGDKAWIFADEILLN